MHVKRVSFHGPRQVEVVATDEQLAPGPGEVLLRTHASLISAGTELAKLTGLQAVEFPHVPGNRAVGEVLAVGEGVPRVRPGDFVFAHTPHASHALTRGFCIPVPEGIEPRNAASLGLSLVAMTAVRVGRPELGDRAVVFGMGLVGNLCAQLYRLSGAEVVIVDTSPSRLETARRCGLEHTVRAGEDTVEQVLALTGSRGAEYVIDASGNPTVMPTACAVARRQGEVILLGSPRAECVTDVTPLLNHVHLWREHGTLTLKGAHEWRYPAYEDAYSKHSMERNAEAIFRLMQDGRLVLDPLLTHVVPAERAAEAFTGLLDRPDDWVGAVLDWSGAG